MKREHTIDDDAFDQNGLLRDGRSVRFRMTAMDAVQRDIARHRPGFINDGRSPAERERMYRVYDQEKEQEWKNPPTGFGSKGCTPDKPSSTEDRALTVDEIYRQYEEKLTSAWRQG